MAEYHEVIAAVTEYYRANTLRKIFRKPPVPRIDIVDSLVFHSVLDLCGTSLSAKKDWHSIPVGSLGSLYLSTVRDNRATIPEDVATRPPDILDLLVKPDLAEKFTVPAAVGTQVIVINEAAIYGLRAPLVYG